SPASRPPGGSIIRGVARSRRLPRMLAAAAALLLLAMPAGAEPPTRESPAVSGLVDGIDLTSPEALGWTEERHQTALRYSRGRWGLWLLGALLGIAAPLFLALSGFAGRLASALEARLQSRLASDSLFIVAIVTCMRAIDLPLELYRFRRERLYGFATQDLPAWLTDEIKLLMVAWVIGLVFLLPMWAAIRRWPRGWWAAGSALAVTLAILGIAVVPVVVAPWFNTFTPLSDESLRSRILAMAAREGVPAEDVYQVDASRQSLHDNAYVVGLLGTQRIVLYDTLLSAYAPEEIEFVVGHEIGHYVLAHIWKGIALTSAAIVLGFFLMHRLLGRTVAAHKRRLGYDSLASIAAVPLALGMLSILLFAATPVSSGVSRYFEHQADAFALEAIRHQEAPRDAAVSAFQKMASRNLSDPNPPALVEWWLYSHPSIGNRIRFCAGR
ncbi:MAG TPA: M48 family metallopeptidase, partial [Candidatus Polarisedimenticolia bacterium]|nr:M48 family metallopeptidase [Candidatus Polarisedimenticolia bacterium]